MITPRMMRVTTIMLTQMMMMMVLGGRLRSRMLNVFESVQLPLSPKETALI